MSDDNNDTALEQRQIGAWISDISEALGLFPSVIKFGEAWSPMCEDVHTRARIAIRKLGEIALCSTPNPRAADLEVRAREDEVERLVRIYSEVTSDYPSGRTETMRKGVRAIIAALSDQAHGGGAGEIDLKPWADYHGDLPDYDHPLRPVYESGIQYAVELLAKELGVGDYDCCDGTEEFDGDLGGTLMRIVREALLLNKDGERMWPSEVSAAISAQGKV